VTRTQWFRYCRPGGGAELTEQLVLLEEQRQLVEEIIAGLKHLLTTTPTATPDFVKATGQSSILPPGPIR
jgi:hypothetical protein